ncbi:hypothetical protein R3P38DRAFT_3227447 [Favolaschia claudopus]|uniref:Uncharacterized protein n=1 Tax=Favolaschia claudopus TaxID=2862362 RepID=A0AAV9ZST7_9AGAR
MSNHHTPTLPASRRRRIRRCVLVYSPSSPRLLEGYPPATEFEFLITSYRYIGTCFSPSCPALGLFSTTLLVIPPVDTRTAESPSLHILCFDVRRLGMDAAARAIDSVDQRCALSLRAPAGAVYGSEGLGGVYAWARMLKRGIVKGLDVTRRLHDQVDEEERWNEVQIEVDYYRRYVSIIFVARSSGLYFIIVDSASVPSSATLYTRPESTVVGHTHVVPSFASILGAKIETRLYNFDDTIRRAACVAFRAVVSASSSLLVGASSLRSRFPPPLRPNPVAVSRSSDMPITDNKILQPAHYISIDPRSSPHHIFTPPPPMIQYLMPPPHFLSLFVYALRSLFSYAFLLDTSTYFRLCFPRTHCLYISTSRIFHDLRSSLNAINVLYSCSLLATSLHTISLQPPPAFTHALTTSAILRYLIFNIAFYLLISHRAFFIVCLAFVAAGPLPDKDISPFTRLILSRLSSSPTNHDL